MLHAFFSSPSSFADFRLVRSIRLCLRSRDGDEFSWQPTWPLGVGAWHPLPCAGHGEAKPNLGFSFLIITQPGSLICLCDKKRYAKIITLLPLINPQDMALHRARESGVHGQGCSRRREMVWVFIPFGLLLKINTSYGISFLLSGNCMQNENSH